MDIAIPLQQMEAYLLVVFRLGGIMFFAPVFGGRLVPMNIKVLMALSFSVVFAGMIQPENIPIPNDSWQLALALTAEMLIGILLGLLGQVMVAAVQFGGHLLGTHFGLRIANVLDPATEETASVLGAFLNVATILFLLSLDFHLILLHAVAKSYELIPPLQMTFNMGVVEVLLRAGGKIYVFAIQVIAPVFAVIFFVEVIIAVLAKTAKQFNLLMLQFPLKISIGFLFLSLLIKVMPRGVETMLGTVLEYWDAVLHLLGDGNG